MLFGELLVNVKHLNICETDIKKALNIQNEFKEKEYKKIGEILVDMSVITKKDLDECLDLREALNKIDLAALIMKMNEENNIPEC